jgi:hypothetical protein
MLRLLLALLLIPFTIEAANAPVKPRKAAPLVSWMPAEEWYIQLQKDYQAGKFNEFLAEVEARYQAQKGSLPTENEPLSARKEKQTLEYYYQLEALKADRNKQLADIANEFPQSYVGKVITEALKPLEPFEMEQAHQEYLNSKLPPWMRTQFGNGNDPFAKYDDIVQEFDAKTAIIIEMLGENSDYKNKEWLNRNTENVSAVMALVKLDKLYRRCKELNDQNCKERFEILLDNYDQSARRFHDKMFLNALGKGYILPSNEPESKVGDIIRNYTAQAKILDAKLGFPIPSKNW